jgi:hypothetical protein
MAFLCFLFQMTSHPFHQNEIDERAFGIFLLEGIQFFLDQDPPLRHGSIHDYSNRLWNRWTQMSDSEKAPFVDRAIEELRRLRRYRRADIYREVMREDILEDNDTRRRRRYDPIH